MTGPSRARAPRQPLTLAAYVAAVAAGLPPFGAVLAGATVAAIGLVATLTLPVVTLLAARRHPAATVAGALHLVLLPLALLSAQGADLRVPLTGALLAVAGLHAGRVGTDRDRAVATLIQLVVVAATLSQLTADDAVGTGLLVAAWGGAVALGRQLAATALPPGGIAVTGRAGRHRWRPLLALFAAAALIWALLPTTSGARQVRELGGGGSPGGTASPATQGADTGGARVGLDRGDIDLTRRGSPSDRQVALVRGGPGLLRAQTFDTYDGTRWSAAGEGVPLTRLGSGPVITVPPVPGDGDASVETGITVSLLAQQDTLMSPGRPRTLFLTGHVVDRDPDGGLTVLQRSGLPAGTTYQVVGGVPAAGTAVAGVATAPHDAATFLQLPARLPQRVRDLAAAWTANAGRDPAQLSAAIAAQLHAGFVYRLDSPVPAAGHDAVDDFLFRARSGFCEQFASAEAVLLRSLGVPARVVAGYANDGHPVDGERLLTDAQAHAWVEYWSPGRGWIADDPTAGVPLAAPLPTPSRSRVPLLRWLAALGVWGVLGLGVLIALAVLTLVLVRRRRRRRAGSAPAPGSAPERPRPGRVAAAWAGLEAALELAGAPRRPSETPAELLLRVPGGWDVRAVVLPPLEREIWGPGVPSPAETAAAEEQLRRLTARLAPAPALRP